MDNAVRPNEMDRPNCRSCDVSSSVASTSPLCVNRFGGDTTEQSNPQGEAAVTVSCLSTEENAPTATTNWQQLADDVLAGEKLTAEQARAVLDCPDEELLDLLAATYRVRRQCFGNQVQLYFLMNAKSGLCPEDCGYCSQSKVSEAEIPRYNLLSRDKLLDGARIAAERKARTYCIVISARGPNEREMRAVTDAPLIAYPNAGLPITRGGETTYELDPEAMAKDYPALLDAGCNVVGGCCGSGPEHIRLIAEIARSRRPR